MLQSMGLHNEKNLTQKAGPASLLTCSRACSPCGRVHMHTAEASNAAEGYSMGHTGFSADTHAGCSRSWGGAGPAIRATCHTYAWSIFLPTYKRMANNCESFSCVRLFATPWTAAHQASLSITNSRSLLKLMSIELVMPSNHLTLSSPSPPAFNLSQHQGLFQ